MADEARVIGIEVGLLEELLRKIVRDEVTLFKEEIKSTLTSNAVSLLQEERLYTNQVAQLFTVTRHTINNYIKQSLLPQPQHDISGRPYWTPDQLEQALKLKGIKTKYPK
jgi:hypothetical protein